MTTSILSEEYWLAINKTPNQAIQDVGVKLLMQGLSPIPVVPAHLNGGYAPIHGKAPSYIDKSGKPKLLKHRQLGLHSRQPTPQEIEQWFSHPDIGIGTFGRDQLSWMDFDLKNFESPEECDRKVEAWLKRNNITGAWRERTGGGGHRVLVSFECPSDFTNFALEPSGKHVGEIKSQGGFVVLAPSLHPSGNRYELISGSEPGKLYSPEFAGLYPVKSQSPKAQSKTVTPTEVSPEPTTKPVNPEPFEVPTEWLHWDALKQAEYIGKHPNCQWQFDDYDRWLKWGMALYNIDENEGFTIWDNLSRQSQKYSFQECWKKWSSFRKSNLGFGSLIHWAKEDGLIFPTGKGDRQAFRCSPGFKQWDAYQAYTPDIVVDQEYLDVAEHVSVDENQVFCVKSKLGGGKTHDSAKWRVKRNRGTRELYAINDLALNTIERVQELTGQAHYHLRFDDDGKALLADSNSHIHNCIDSLRKYSPQHFEGVDIYIDEPLAVLPHAANGETLGGSQTSIIRKLNRGFQDCGSIFLMDGNHRNLECDLVGKKSGKKIVKILNTSKPPKRKVTFITGVKINDEGNEQKDLDDITAICSLVINKARKNHKLWIGTDSKNFSKRFFDVLTEDKSTKKFGFRVLLINSENSKEDWAKEFKRKPKEWLEQNPHDIVIFSPSCAYGLDVHNPVIEEDRTEIDNPVIEGKGWFTEQYYIYRGAIGTLPQTQQMRRLRDNDVPTFVFCPERSTIPRDGILGQCFAEQSYKQAIHKVLAEAAQIGSSSTAIPEFFMQKVNESLREMDMDWFEYSIKLKIIDNFEKENLKECLIYKLEQANYEIEEIDIRVCSETKTMLDEAKDRVNVMDANKIFTAPEIDKDAYDALKQQAEKSDEERAIIEKYELLKRLPGIKESRVWSAEFIKRRSIEENYKLIEGLELAEALNNAEKAKQELFTSWAYIFSGEDEAKGVTYQSSLSPIRQARKSKEHLRALALIELGIPQLTYELVDGREITKDDIDLRELVQKWRDKYSHKLGLYPEKPQKKKGKVIEGSETIPSIKKLLELIAFPIKSGKKKKVNGKVVVPYSADTEALGDSERCVIEECIAKREEELVEESRAKHQEKGEKLIQEGELISVVRNLEGLELFEKLKELKHAGRYKPSDKHKLSSELQAKIRRAMDLGALANEHRGTEVQPESHEEPTLIEASEPPKATQKHPTGTTILVTYPNGDKFSGVITEFDPVRPNPYTAKLEEGFPLSEAWLKEEYFEACEQPRPQTLIDKACDVLKSAKTPSDILSSGLTQTIPREIWEDVAFADSLGQEDRERRLALVKEALESEELDTEVLLHF